MRGCLICMKTKLMCWIATTLLLAACGAPKPIPHDCITWVNNYYIQHPVSGLSSTTGGWLFRGAKAFGSELRVGFLIPEAMDESANKRRAILNRICPQKFEKIWQILPYRNTLTIHVWTEDKKFKDLITC